MKSDKRRWTILVILASCSPVLPQNLILTGNEINNSTTVSSVAELKYSSTVSVAAEKRASSGSPSQGNSDRPYGWDIAVYPAMAWAPIFGVSVNLPATPTNPIAPGPSGSTNTSFNGAYFGGARIEKNKFSVDALFMWAALSASRTTPNTNVSLDFVFGDAMAGYEVIPGLYAEAGFRRLALDTTATIGSDTASRSPGYWDPLIGLSYRRDLGKKWRIIVHGDGGGFGVGSDVDVAITGRAEWQFVRHFGMTMGYGGMHFSNSTGAGANTFTIKPTMHGPIVGIGTYF
jgi:hypothetical protein